MKKTKKKSKTSPKLLAANKTIRLLRAQLHSLVSQQQSDLERLRDAGFECNCTYYCECGLRKLGF